MKKIISYNVNGIRAALNKGLSDWLKEENPDIICIQETKAQPEQIDTLVFKQLGYHPYCFSAQKKGYSGVIILTKTTPDNVEYGIGIEKYDIEGRLIRLDFKDITLINTYFPSGTTGDIRQGFKMQWLADFQKYIDNLKRERENLIVSGDFNICHKPIDIHHPERHKHVSGFLPEEREWVDGFVNSGFIDSFRKFNKNPDNYTWWSYRFGARAKNLGWRIDYNMLSEPLESRLKSASILKDIVHSDHCPVLAEVDF